MMKPLVVAILSLCVGTAARAQVHVVPSPLSPLQWSVRPAATSGYLPAPDAGPIGDWSGYASPGPDGKNTFAPNGYHLVYRPPATVLCSPPACGPRHLVVFLPGHTFQPSDYTAFLTTAYNAGFYVIGLDYPNPKPESAVCANTPSCFADMRNKIVFADGPFSGNGVDIDDHPQDAVAKRLKAILLYMDDHDPLGGWQDYLVTDPTIEDGVRPNYGRIVFADHSGYASFIASKKQVARVVMLASVVDSTGLAGNPVSAPWIVSGNPTASSNYWGIVNTLDNCNGTTGATDNHYPRIERNWTHLAVPNAQGIEVTDSSGGCACGTNPLACHMSVAINNAHAAQWLTLLGPIR